jgi:hypothetical protein
MKLIKYDNKCIKIIDIFGCEYEGNCSYCNKEYNEHEYGRNEDSLQILNYMFYKDTIKKIIVLKNGFIDDYGTIEKEIVNDGVEDILDAFDYEDNDHICRIIRCIKDNNNFNKEELDRIKDYLKNNKDEKVIEELKKLEI